jgi:ABC-type methionine transport system ATPase subunit
MSIRNEEAGMAEKTVRLVYPQELVDVPVITHLIRRFDLTVNIVGAEILPQDGWIEVQLSGSPTVIEEALSWLEELGLKVTTAYKQ